MRTIALVALCAIVAGACGRSRSPSAPAARATGAPAASEKAPPTDPTASDASGTRPGAADRAACGRDVEPTGDADADVAALGAACAGNMRPLLPAAATVELRAGERREVPFVASGEAACLRVVAAGGPESGPIEIEVIDAGGRSPPSRGAGLVVAPPDGPVCVRGSSARAVAVRAIGPTGTAGRVRYAVQVFASRRP